MKRKINKFLDQQTTNRQNVRFAHISVYLRKGTHYIDKKMVHTLDFANLGVDEMPGVAGAMEVVKFVKAAEQVCAERKLPLYVECVHHPGLQGFFRRRGYRLVDELNHCYLK